MTPFYEVTCGKSFDHVNDKRGNKAEDQKGVSEPTIERLAKELFMKDDIDNQNLDIPTGPSPEASPALA